MIWLHAVVTATTVLIASWFAYRKGLQRGYVSGLAVAVENAALGVDDGLQRTELPRPGAPAAGIHAVDFTRGTLQRDQPDDY